jgi:hypothetical protein
LNNFFQSLPNHGDFYLGYGDDLPSSVFSQREAMLHPQRYAMAHPRRESERPDSGSSALKSIIFIKNKWKK